MSAQSSNNYSPQSFDAWSVASQNATDTLTAITDSVADVRSRTSLAYTLKAATQNVRWSVYAGNLSDFTDEAIVQAEATVTAGSVGSFSTAFAVFLYYRVKLRTAVAGVVGSAIITASAKK